MLYTCMGGIIRNAWDCWKDIIWLTQFLACASIFFMYLHYNSRTYAVDEGLGVLRRDYYDL